MIVLNNTITAFSIICLRVSDSKSIGFFANKCSTGGFSSQMSVNLNISSIKVTGNVFAKNSKYPILNYQSMNEQSMNELTENITKNLFTISKCTNASTAFTGLSSNHFDLVQSKNQIVCKRN